MCWRAWGSVGLELGVCGWCGGEGVGDVEVEMKGAPEESGWEKAASAARMRRTLRKMSSTVVQLRAETQAGIRGLGVRQGGGAGAAGRGWVGGADEVGQRGRGDVHVVSVREGEEYNKAWEQAPMGQRCGVLSSEVLEAFEIRMQRKQLYLREGRQAAGWVARRARSKCTHRNHTGGREGGAGAEAGQESRSVAAATHLRSASAPWDVAIHR